MKFVIATVLSTVMWIGAYNSALAGPPGPPTLDVNVVNDEQSPVPVTIQNGGTTIVEYRYIGTTTGTTDGNVVAQFPSGQSAQGVAALHRFCAIEFGEDHPGVRAATPREAQLTTDPLPQAPAWVVAVDLSAVQSVDDTWVAVDTSTGEAAGGQQPTPHWALQAANCRGYRTWTAGGGWGMGPVIADESAPASGIVLQECNIESPVACAAPVAFSVGQ